MYAPASCHKVEFLLFCVLAWWWFACNDSLCTLKYDLYWWSLYCNTVPLILSGSPHDIISICLIRSFLSLSYWVRRKGVRSGSILTLLLRTPLAVGLETWSTTTLQLVLGTSSYRRYFFGTVVVSLNTDILTNFLVKWCTNVNASFLFSIYSWHKRITM